jgi:hydroxypyruvate isomerase
MRKTMSRRSAIRKVTRAGITLSAAGKMIGRTSAAEATAPLKLKGRIRQSVCRWCYSKIPLDQFCQSIKEMGLGVIDLIGEADFPTLKKYDLVCGMVSGVPGGITNGLNRLENHDKIVEYFETAAPRAAEHGYPNLICFSGNRKGMSDAQGLENCAIGLKRIAPIIEKHKVTVCMELLNSKRDHHDYMCDHTAWGVELCKQVGSERVKLLYDIYHMQIMEGDLIGTIRENHEYIGHFHTGGVPGRGEIDETQEINYPAVMRAIAETGYTGFVAQEFVPKRADKLASLRQALSICDV